MALLGTVTRVVVVGRKTNELLVCRYAGAVLAGGCFGWTAFIGVKREMTRLGTVIRKGNG